MLARKISSRDARANFSDLLGSVYYTKQPVIVERKGKAVAVLVSPEQFEKFENIKAEGWAVVDALRKSNVGVDPGQVYKEVTAQVEQVRQEMYDKEQKKVKARGR